MNYVAGSMTPAQFLQAAEIARFNYFNTFKKRVKPPKLSRVEVMPNNSDEYVDILFVPQNADMSTFKKLALVFLDGRAEFDFDAFEYSEDEVKPNVTFYEEN